MHTLNNSADEVKQNNLDKSKNEVKELALEVPQPNGNEKESKHNSKKMPYNCDCGLSFENSQKKAAHCKTCPTWRSHNEPTRSRLKTHKKRRSSNPSSPRTPRSSTPRKMKRISEDDSSDEERSYKRSLRRRLALEQAERVAIIETREKWEQQSLNNRFFRLNGELRRSMQQKEEAYQNLIATSLIQDVVIPAELEEDFSYLLESPQTRTEVLHTPEFRSVETKPKKQIRRELVPEDENNSRSEQKEELSQNQEEYEEENQEYNLEIDARFWKEYRAGYIKVNEPQPETPKKATPSPKKKELFISPSKRQFKIFKFFDPNSWCEQESHLFKELLFAHGKNFQKISELLLSKTADQLKYYFNLNGYHIFCQLCGTSSDDDKLLLCDGCDRAYHTYCLDPPLKVIPKFAWYCSEQCIDVHKKECEHCRKTDDEQNMLLCDICDKGYHIYCLNPSLEEIPKGEWNCGCQPTRGFVKSKQISKPMTEIEQIQKLKSLLSPKKARQSPKSSRVPKKINKKAFKFVKSLGKMDFSCYSISEFSELVFSQTLDIEELKQKHLASWWEYASIFKTMPEIEIAGDSQYFDVILASVKSVFDSITGQLFPAKERLVTKTDDIPEEDHENFLPIFISNYNIFCECPQNVPKLKCSKCKKEFHESCLTSKMKQKANTEEWQCPQCSLTRCEVLAATIYVGFNEVLSECRRLLQEKCEEVCSMHARNILRSTSKEKVLKSLDEYAEEIEQKKLDLLIVANGCYQSWAISLLKDSKS